MSLWSRIVGCGILACVLLGSTVTAEAGRRHGCQDCTASAPCDSCQKGPVQAPCPPQMVEKTILVPQMTMEKRTVCVTEYRCEPRKEIVTVCRLVPEITRTKKIVTDMVPEKRTRIEKCMVRKPVVREVECEVVVMVPHKEKREETRLVTRYVTTKEKRVVCEDQGQYEDRVIETPVCATDDDCHACGRRGWRRRGCAACDVTACSYSGGEKQVPGEKQAPAETCKTTVRVWVPKMVEREIEVDVKTPKCVEEKCEYTVVVCRPEKQKVKRCVTEYIEEPSERCVTYFECVPKQREVTCCNVTYKRVTEDREMVRMIRVPQQVQKEICVPVCKMVEKKVLCPVCPPCSKCR